MVYNTRDHNWIPNATDSPWANCPGKGSEHKNYVIDTLGLSLQLANITLTFDVASEPMYYGKVRKKCDIERCYCHAIKKDDHAIKTTVICDSENHCLNFDVGRSYARMIKFQKLYFIETLENNEYNSGQKHNAHMYSSRFQKQLYDESALSRFDVLTKPIYKCNEDRPYYATQYHDFFIQYKGGFNFVSGKPSSDFDNTHITVPDGPPSLTPSTKANIRDGYVIPQESQLYHKSEKKTNYLENKIGLAQFTLVYKSMRNSIT